MRAALLLLLAITSLARGDTVTTTSNVSCNGRITTLDAARLLMAARFVGETKEILIERHAIKSIEFNQNDYNSMPVRGPFYVRPPRTPIAPKTVPKNEARPTGPRDVIYFLSGERIEAEVLAVDDADVRVSGNQSFRRMLVHSIRFASR